MQHFLLLLFVSWPETFKEGFCTKSLVLFNFRCVRICVGEPLSMDTTSFFHVCMWIITHDFSTVVSWVHCNKGPSKMIKNATDVAGFVAFLVLACWQHLTLPVSRMSRVSTIMRHLRYCVREFRTTEGSWHVLSTCNHASTQQDFFFLSWPHLLLWKSGFLMDESRFWL